jgi:MYXO-CTERM domain-containing protein
MKRFSAAVLVFFFLAAEAHAGPTWTVSAPAARAQITGGPWVLSQGTVQNPLASYPSSNPGTSAMQPFYQGFVTGDETTAQGYFDYRIKDVEEAVVAAISHDRGATWTFQSKTLDFLSPSLANDAAAADDSGEGHPFVMTVGGKTRLYTLDRSATYVDSAGLVVRELSPTMGDPLAGAPGMAQQGASAPARTSGMLHPDGIIGVVPGSNPTKVLYLEKDISVTPNVTRVHVAQTADGVAFTNDALVSGLTDTMTTFIGPRGTIWKFADGHYGLFFSAGLVGEDADAFHYIGYAESMDALTWTVSHGVSNPLLSIDAMADPKGGQPWYAGRVYAPSAILSADGCRAAISFSGYKTAKPKNALNDYRQIGFVEVTRTCASMDAGADSGASADSGAIVDSGASPDGGGGGEMKESPNGCSCEAGAGGASPFLGVIALAIVSRLRRRGSTARPGNRSSKRSGWSKKFP